MARRAGGRRAGCAGVAPGSVLELPCREPDVRGASGVGDRPVAADLALFFQFLQEFGCGECVRMIFAEDLAPAREAFAEELKSALAIAGLVQEERQIAY